jgi:hypothetical protein
MLGADFAPLRFILAEKNTFSAIFWPNLTLFFCKKIDWVVVDDSFFAQKFRNPIMAKLVLQPTSFHIVKKMRKKIF